MSIHLIFDVPMAQGKGKRRVGVPANRAQNSKTYLQPVGGERSLVKEVRVEHVVLRLIRHLDVEPFPRRVPTSTMHNFKSSNVGVAWGGAEWNGVGPGRVGGSGVRSVWVRAVRGRAGSDGVGEGVEERGRVEVGGVDGLGVGAKVGRAERVGFACGCRGGVEWGKGGRGEAPVHVMGAMGASATLIVRFWR